MNKTLEMIEKRNQAWNAAKAFVESRRDKDGLLSEADAKTYAEMEQKVRNYSAEIERLQAMEAMDAEMSRPLGTPITGRPMNGSAEDKPAKTGRASDEYRKAMLNALRSNFRQISNVLQEGIDAQGGYLVPEEYDSRLIDALKEENVVRKIAHSLPTSGEHKINIAATKPAAAWIEEGGALSFGEATFDQIILDAHKLHVAIKVTEELLYDSAFPLEQYILDAFTKALANAEEDAFINGTGTGQPLGILAATGGAQVGKTLESTDVTADDVIDLIYYLKRPYRKNAVFLTNDKCVAALRKLKDENGQFLWQPSLQAGEPDTCLGYKIYTSPFFPEPGPNKAVLAFGDFSYYNIGDRGPRSFAELKELFAGNGMVGFVAKERVDGKLVLPEAIKLLKTGAAKSSK